MRRFRRPDGRLRFIESHYSRVSVWEGFPGDEVSATNSFHTAETIAAEFGRRVAETLAAGYVEIPDGIAAIPEGERTLATALADAVAGDPDDLAAAMAEADYLAEQGDTRGEFVQVQLALEDATRSPAEREELRRREAELLAAHEAEWLGDLAFHLTGPEEDRREAFVADLNDQGWGSGGMVPNTRHRWARGRLDAFVCENVTVGAMRLLGASPLARCLREFRVENSWCNSSNCTFRVGPDLPSTGWFYPCEVLAFYPAARNVRVFQFGPTPDPESDEYAVGCHLRPLSPLLSKMPRLEELYVFGYWTDGEDESRDVFSLPTLSRLRVLQHYHGQDYPLEALADNAALTNLTHLLCYPHSFATADPDGDGGPALNLARLTALARSPYLRSLTHLQLRCCDAGDAGVEELIASGMLGRLRWLDLRHGHVTDAGAKMLAACDAAKGLEALDLVNNRLTPDGLEVLRRAGIRARTERQQVTPYRDDAIMYYGDGE